MRIILSTTRNTKAVPFNHQQKLVGCLHKWLGKENDEHGNLSLYSFSWLKGGTKKQNALDFPNGASWFISYYDDTKIKTIIDTILKDPEMFCGMKVAEIVIQENPDFSNRELFFCASPIFIKRHIEETQSIKHYSYSDEGVSQLLKETIISKMGKANIPIDDTFSIVFDLSYAGKKQKLAIYDGIKNKANICPVIITGRPETKAFIWNVGVGNCTGIGMGAII